MILVTGSILAREETFDDVLRSSLEHVERSRKEPGCISHDVHVDCQNPMRLFFFKQWADEAALRTHSPSKVRRCLSDRSTAGPSRHQGRRSIAPRRYRDRKVQR
ncbi:putative quinol monooxygenase [Bradyrhizobium sp. AZCC 1678]|uniref:putative quinol monooxygenase n=1 Tax=Bradyrhizobium sp. AZCC 1678 TaxID=3117030 RepID=UPI002FF33B05